MSPRRAAIALVAGSLLLAAPALAQESRIYKWRDANGVVHYSNTPPPKGTDATVLDQSKSKVSVVPAIQAPPDAAGNERQIQNRVQRLERELEDERRSQAAEECLKQRRLDCDDPAAVPVEVYGYPAPPVVRPPIARPPKPPASTAPPGYIVGPGPAGIGGQYVPAPPRPQQPPALPEQPRPR